MKNFIKKLSKIQTLIDSIGKDELQRLVVNLTDEYECKKDLESNLMLFFSLNSSDVEYTLKSMRDKSIENNEEDKIGNEFLKKNELMIDQMIGTLNKVSLRDYNKPFHLAAALGELNVSKAMADSFKIDFAGILSKEKQQEKKLGDACPQGFYPRYVGMVWPWKLRKSWNISIYQRKEDVGCHYQHGPFDGIIRGWVTFSPQIILMVLLQGWGFNLAANNNHFFYKWWFVIAAGLSPYSCMNMLFARKF